MAEIRHTFQGGKMNKDLDERLVPQGEYRDALNIEVRTSGDSDIGAIQNLYGTKGRLSDSKYGAINPTISWVGRPSCNVGSITNEKTNKAYFFVASPLALAERVHADYSYTDIVSTKLYKDMIIEYDNITKHVSPVAIDVWRIETPIATLGSIGNGSSTTQYNKIAMTGSDASVLAKNIRPGMVFNLYTEQGDSLISTYSQEQFGGDNGLGFGSIRVLKVEEDKTVSGTINVYFDRYVIGDLTNAHHCMIRAEKTLDFSNYNQLYDSYKEGTGRNIITGINIIDDLLFWTDNKTEPRKINIKRSKAGSEDGFDVHTSLMINDPAEYTTRLTSLHNVDPGTNSAIIKDHTTVIRRAPRTSPKLEMSENLGDKIVGESSLIHWNSSFNSPYGNNTEESKAWHTVNFSPNGSIMEPGDIVQIATGPDFQVGQGDRIEIYHEDYSVIVKVLTVTASESWARYYDAEIDMISNDIPSNWTTWSVKVFDDRQEPYFQLKFGRFSFRYKYQDGEYSSFAPWSELAFLPGQFDYVPKKGHNLGMVNNVRVLNVTDFIVDDALRPDEVVEVDILYKDTVSPNVYIVKTIKRSRDHEWKDKGTGSYKGLISITSEMIHRTLESSQALRAWDNVPRKALAQEVTGNRIVYGNYIQNYDVNKPVFVKQSFISSAHPGSPTRNGKRVKVRKDRSVRVPDGMLGNVDLENASSTLNKPNVPFLYPNKSLKSIRKYRVGVVFGDKYGRETPVMGLGGVIERDVDQNVEGEKYPDSVNVGKEFCANVNKLTAQLEWKGTKPEDWMEYCKFYVKETSNEYYNMVQDRWYHTEDGNIWLSFQSADRNKVDIETYLILKNEHGNQTPVLEKARYKILAIKNEAPDFIKTTSKIIGSAPMLGGYDLENSMIVSFDGDIFNQSFGGLAHVIDGFKGVGYGRLRGIEGETVRYSKWIKIANVNPVNHSVTLVDPFGDSANFAESLGLDNFSELDAYEFEMKDDVVENRPEFDGKFFVKIYKDAVLSTKILDETEDGLTYNVVNQVRHGYVLGSNKNTKLNTGALYSGNYSNEANPTPGTLSNSTEGAVWSHSNGHNQYNANRLAFCGSIDDTKNFWEWYNDHSKNKGAAFIDDARYVDLNGGGNDQDNVDPDAFMNETNPDHIPQPMQGINMVKFSAIGPSAFTNGSAANDLWDALSVEGTLFRFSGDPLKTIYQIHSTFGGPSTPEFVRNYHKNSTWCNACDQDWHASGLCGRSYFRIYFHQKGNKSRGLDTGIWDPRSSLKHDGNGSAFIEIVQSTFDRSESVEISQGNAIWETEPKEDLDMDLYYEATDAIPMYLKNENIQSFIPIGSAVKVFRNGQAAPISDQYQSLVVRSGARDVISMSVVGSTDLASSIGLSVGDVLQFTHMDGTVTQTSIIQHWDSVDGALDTNYKPSQWDNAGDNGHGTKQETGYYRLNHELFNQPVTLSWFNCYSFGNGLESNRIRDDFNAPTIDNGAKVSSVLDSFGEEHRSSGMIWSGIYNSTSGINNLNEFNMANPITKDLNPSYGSVQALKTRDTNVVAFCEDKVFKILANKDALYNADGSANVTASNAVLGDAQGFSGDFGISSNPESLAVDSYRMYFTDKQRNKVLRLSQDGLTPISDVGMSSYFRDNLGTTQFLIGSFDEIKGEYNLSLVRKPGSSLNDITVSFNEKTKGWPSFKSFVPETGLSINDEYLTGKGVYNASATDDFNHKLIWSHHNEDLNTDGSLEIEANNFYGVHYNSTVDVMFNQSPESVKGFTSMNYEGTQAKIDGYTSLSDTDANNNTVTENNPNYEHLSSKTGWYVSSFATDLQEANVPDFIGKENKWFNYVKGTNTTLSNLDTKEFSVQGFGLIDIVSKPLVQTYTLTIKENNA